MKLVRINDNIAVNPEHVLCVNRVPEKLMVVVVLNDKMIVESKFTYEETLQLVTGETQV